MTKDEKQYVRGIVASGAVYTNTVRDSYKPPEAVRMVKVIDPFGKGEKRSITFLGVRIF